VTDLAERPEIVDPATGRGSNSIGDYLRAYVARVRSGDLGNLPIIIGILLIVGVFASLTEFFLTTRNFVNLILQMTQLTTIAIGIVFVLLLGEIDLSVGFVSGVAAVAMARLSVEEGFPWFVAIAGALIVGAVIGLIQGTIITRFRVPSFVVTLAGLLIWNGVVLITIAGRGTFGIDDDVIQGISNAFLPDIVSYVIAALFVAGFAFLQLARRRARLAAGLSTVPLAIIGARIAVVGVLVLGAVFFANQERGVPYAALLMLVLLVFWSLVANRTRFGRHVYAVGGNAEAARRAGIAVDRVRTTVFIISATMAALGGVVGASRLQSVDPSVGGGPLLLNAIAAAVIGGTSLFGGHGKVTAALFGALIIASVDNGMGLLNLSTGARFVVTGLVLLAAVLVDALSARGRAARGLA
jgi:D-xylose transport system permease protein